MPRNYGTGAYGGGNYSATTAASLAAARGSFVETGQAAALAWQTGMAGASGSFGLSGVAASLKAAFKQAAAQAVLTLTGVSATLARAAVVAAGQGAYGVAGQAAIFAAQFVATAAQAFVVLIGRPASSFFANLWAPEPDGAPDWTDPSSSTNPWTPMIPDATGWKSH